MSEMPRTKEQATPQERDERGHIIVPAGERIATISADGRTVDIWWRNDGGVTLLHTVPVHEPLSPPAASREPPSEPPQMQDGCGRMNRAAYQRMVDEDVAWLESVPRTLERDHVIAIVRQSVEREYGPSDAASVPGEPPQRGK